MTLFIAFVLIAAVVGVLNAAMTGFIDSLLDFGHAFGKVRYFAAVRSAERLTDAARDRYNLIIENNGLTGSPELNEGLDNMTPELKQLLTAAGTTVDHFEKLEGMTKSIPNDPIPTGDFADRLDFADSVYWNLAKYDRRFVAWICRFCISTRIAIFTSLIVPALFASDVFAGPAFGHVPYLLKFLLTYVPAVSIVMIINSAAIKKI